MFLKFDIKSQFTNLLKEQIKSEFQKILNKIKEELKNNLKLKNEDKKRI